MERGREMREDMITTLKEVEVATLDGDGVHEVDAGTRWERGDRDPVHWLELS